MPLPSPNLDDRTFHQLVDEARRRIAQSCPEWTDLSPGDPGIVLLELFAHLTEVMLYRLNRIPEKVYVEFLGLMGVQVQPPSAAAATLRFTVSRPQERPIVIPRGTRVTVARSPGEGEPPVFVTARTVSIAPGTAEVEVTAHHGELIEAEQAGYGTGLPGLWVSARRPPIVAPTGDELDLQVGIETPPGDLSERVRAVEHDGKAYRIWREVDSFTDLGPDRYAYMCDRMTGKVIFAPAVQARTDDGELAHVPEALAEVPPAGREIRLWYRRGGGNAGNVLANTLSTLKDAIPGVQVTNPQAATGGRNAESLENALIRGPQELHSLRRAVTARDFELVALKSGSVARAKAFTKAMLWAHAAPGTVEVLLVPYLKEESRGGGQVTAERLKQLETEETLVQLRQSLDERRPLGTTCLVNWVRYKTVRVKARVVVHSGEDQIAVESRVIERLHQTINPLPTPLYPGAWRFGQPLRVSHVYDIVLSEPGVSYADQVRLLVDEVPGKDVRSIAADNFQRHTWYAGAGQTLYRSVDNCDGWEPAGEFPEEHVVLVEVHPTRPGLLAVCTGLHEDQGGSRIHVSWDCGETWRTVAETAFSVEDLAWMTREGTAVLLLATEVGLYELTMQPGAAPVQILVEVSDQDLGFYAVAAATDIRGNVSVAVSARGTGGVYLSTQAGRPGTFSNSGLKGEDIRVLEVQQLDVSSFLWAGVTVAGNEPGRGCFRIQLTASAEGWKQFDANWPSDSCRALTFQGATVVAATHHSGILRLDSRRSEAAWQAPVVGCGLPIRDVEHIFQPVDTVAIAPDNPLIVAGGRVGVYRSRDEGLTYEKCSSEEFTEKVTLPETWLFCSGEHEIRVVSEDEAN
jgi:hypothetical protein